MSLPPLDGTPDPNGGDCLACGRCCHHPPSSVGLLAHDEARFDEPTLVRLTVLDPRPPHLRFMRNRDGHCIALDGFACTIYASRPDGCRTLEAGSPACLEARSLGHLGQSVEYALRDRPSSRTGG